MQLSNSSRRALEYIQAVKVSVVQFKEEYTSALNNSTCISSTSHKQVLTRHEKCNVQDTIRNILGKGIKAMDKLGHLFSFLTGWINDPLIWSDSDGKMLNTADGMTSAINIALLKFHPDRIPRYVHKDALLMFRIECLRNCITELQGKIDNAK